MRLREKAFTDLIGCSYDAALNPVHWTELVDRLAKFFNASLITSGVVGPTGGARFIDVSGFDESDLRQFNAYYARQNPWIRELQRQKLLGRVPFRASHQIVSDAALERTEEYQDFYGPRKIHYGFGCTLSTYQGGSFILGVSRPKSAGPITNSEEGYIAALLPHMRRAALIASELRFLSAERMAASRESSDARSPALFILDEQGRVIHMNESAGLAVRSIDGLRLSAEGIRTSLTNQNARLQACIRGAALAARADDSPGGGAMTIDRPSGRRPYWVVVSPIRRDVLNCRIGCPTPAVLVMVLDPEQTEEPCHDLFRRLLGLTQAQSRFASLLLSGLSVEEAAGELQVSLNTARTHLKSIFQITGTRRQAELVLLLNRVQSIAPKGAVRIA